MMYDYIRWGAKAKVKIKFGKAAGPPAIVSQAASPTNARRFRLKLSDSHLLTLADPPRIRSQLNIAKQ